MHRLPLTRSYGRNYELSLMGVGSGLYMYDVVVKCSRSLSHLLMSSGLCCVHVWGCPLAIQNVYVTSC